ncbi:chemoreceptor glutamine deamidase CheD [Bradyrhizobium sp.]|uniref:chemoreceptor glutamine deamidase CheD n=1 Tax=Bradyrhizobium sp. TaxID=376 RepID=UPI003C5D0781
MSPSRAHKARIVHHTTETRRYRDPRFDAMAIKVFPGEHYVTGEADEMLVTILGSCVTACIRDPLLGIGGMNHFMLPEAMGGGWDTASASMRYGNVAMERLINDILARGGARQRLEIKVFGGGNVMGGTANIGHRNAEFVEGYLAAENLAIAASHLRGHLPRRVHYFPVSGKVMLLELQRTEQESVVRIETSYKSKIQSEPVSGSIELF